MDIETVSVQSGSVNGSVRGSVRGSIPPSQNTEIISNVNSDRVDKTAKDSESSRSKNESRAVKTADSKIESRLNMKDLEALYDAFETANDDGGEYKLSFTVDQFCEALTTVLNKGTKEEYVELFDKIDVTREGLVDWDKLASHMLLEFYEKDDRVKSTQVPQWKDIRHLPSPHKELIQRVSFLKTSNRYIGISKEGCVSLWDQNLKLQRSLKTGTDTCRARDLWVTHFVPLQNLNKIALSFTSKEIAIYDLSTKLEFSAQYKVQGLDFTPLCLDYWPNPQNTNEAILSWGDTGGYVNAIQFNSATIALFERPPAPAGEKQEPCLNVQLNDVSRNVYKNAGYYKYTAHSEWVRQVLYSINLECFISCSTTWNKSLVIGWLEKHSTTQTIKMNKSSTSKVRKSYFDITQGVNAFAYHETLNLIATANVNHHVCLWNPYVDSKPNGVLRGHMASVVQVQFHKARGQLLSFSKDKVLRIWDVQLQVCIQRLAGMFPKGPEVNSVLFFDEARNKLFISFNYQLTYMEIKPEVKDRIMTHDKPVVAAVYNDTYNQVVSICQGGHMVVWMIDTGQKVKQFPNTHVNAEITAFTQDRTEARLYTAGTDGTVKVWDFNGHCYHTLQCGHDGQPADVGHILALKRSVIVVGWTKYITIFRKQNFKEYHVLPADWKGGQDHSDDILASCFSAPSMLATGSYDGEIVIWNNNSEQASRHLTQRCRTQMSRRTGMGMQTRENTLINEGGTRSRSVAQGSTSAGQRSRSDYTRPSTMKSRAASRLSIGSADDNETSNTIHCMEFLEARKGLSASGAANLVTCGGNGWVRFWSTAHNALLAEFIAHKQSGSIIMGVERTSQWLVTGDVDGIIKVWDIAEYCMKASDEIITDPPTQHSQWQPHSDMLTSLEFVTRNDRLLVLSASSDCSVALWDIYGNQIGVFGQEQHWKIEPYVPQEETEEKKGQEIEEPEIKCETPQSVDAEESPEVEDDEDSNWEADTAAIDDPVNYRLNAWDKTYLGKDYQELRVKKRERKQPQTIVNLPYLTWEKTGQAPAGPYAALDTSMLSATKLLQKPDFIANPHKYFSERIPNDSNKLPQLAENEKYVHPSLCLKAAFDEKSLFPKSLLDFEVRMKQNHQQVAAEEKLRGTTKGHGSGSVGHGRAQSPNRRNPQVGMKLNRLKKATPAGSD